MDKKVIENILLFDYNFGDWSSQTWLFILKIMFWF